MLQWVATYRGGGTLLQYNEDGTENKYGDIDRGRLDRFLLLNDGRPLVVLNMGESKKLIYRRRTAMDVHSKKKDVVHIIGFQSDKGQTILFYFESTGHIEVTDGFKDGHRWFYPIRFLPEEEV